MNIYINRNKEIIESEVELTTDDVNLGTRFADLYYLNSYVLLTDEQVKLYNENKDNKDFKLYDLFSDYTENKTYYYVDTKNRVTSNLYGFPKNVLITKKPEYFRPGIFLELTDEQTAFYLEHPNATADEIINMAMVEIDYEALELQDAKITKLKELAEYDNSENVNSFDINGLTAWFTVEERNNYAQSIQAAKILGQEYLMFFIGNQELTVPTAMAEQLLAAIQLYADASYIVTKKHQIAIEALETAVDVDNYDFTLGYPERLKFTLG